MNVVVIMKTCFLVATFICFALFISIIRDDNTALLLLLEALLADALLFLASLAYIVLML